MGLDACLEYIAEDELVEVLLWFKTMSESTCELPRHTSCCALPMKCQFAKNRQAIAVFSSRYPHDNTGHLPSIAWGWQISLHARSAG